MAAAVPPRDRRLQAGWQFREVYRKGRPYHGELMTLITLPQPEDHGRVGYVAGRRVGSAVKRNRAKRLLREAFRALPEERKDMPVWRIWIAKAACAASTLGEVTEEMGRLAAREP